MSNDLSIAKAAKAGLANFLKVFAVACMLGVIGGMLGRWHYVLDLASHFRMQVTIAMLVVGAVFWPLQHSRWSIVCLLLGGSLAATLVPFIGNGGLPSKDAYRLLSMNVLRRNQQKDKVVDYILRQDPDFVVLQETDATWIHSISKGLGDKWPYRESVPQDDNFGIAIYSKIPWSSCETLTFSEQIPNPSISVHFELDDGKRLRVIGTHPVPPMKDRYWRARNESLQNLANDVASGQAERTIVAGDLNCSPWSVHFSDLLNESGLTNCARGNGLGISWMPFHIKLLGLPIDHVLAGERIEILRRVIGPDLGSDHRPVVVDFR